MAEVWKIEDVNERLSLSEANIATASDDGSMCRETSIGSGLSQLVEALERNRRRTAELSLTIRRRNGIVSMSKRPMGCNFNARAGPATDD